MRIGLHDGIIFLSALAYFSKKAIMIFFFKKPSKAFYYSHTSRSDKIKRGEQNTRGMSTQVLIDLIPEYDVCAI